ncbi:MAG: YciI family protein [Bradyrhizobium sp.]|nr:YciI family protein [Bradyrhizobium sp.]
MLYAILAYHVEAELMSWTPEQDAAVMTEMLRVHGGLNEKQLLGPSARLGATGKAHTLRGPGAGMVIDGPFAETKEQLLGFHIVDCADEDAALAVAGELRKVNPTAVYEIRPIALYIPGKPVPTTQDPDAIGRDGTRGWGFAGPDDRRIK